MVAMNTQLPPNLTSFVIRFVIEPAETEQSPSYRGMIRHIQTEEEINFSDWDEAVMFIQRYVPLESKNI